MDRNATAEAEKPDAIFYFILSICIKSERQLIKLNYCSPKTNQATHTLNYDQLQIRYLHHSKPNQDQFNK